MVPGLQPRSKGIYEFIPHNALMTSNLHGGKYFNYTLNCWLVRE